MLKHITRRIKMLSKQDKFYIKHYNHRKAMGMTNILYSLNIYFHKSLLKYWENHGT